MLKLIKLLKQPVLAVMVRLCDDFCAMFLEMLWTSTGSVIRNVVSRSLWASRGLEHLQWDKADVSQTLEHPIIPGQ